MKPTSDTFPNCVFCEKIVDGSATEIGRSGVFHFEPLNPVTPGHRLFVPREHISKVNLSSPLLGMTFNAASQYAMYESRRKTDFNLIINVGKDATQTIPHLHVHYVPRKSDDGLILPWSNQEIEKK